MPEQQDANTISFTLKPVAPFRLDYTVWALRRRPGNAIDRWDGLAWRRVHELAGGVCEVRVTQAGPPENPSLRVLASGRALTADAKTPIRKLLTRMLGLDRDLAGFYELTRHDRIMAALAERFRGVRLPRFPTLFEALVNGIACQQLSLTVGIIVLNRLAESYGARFSTPDGTAFGFPGPEKLAGADMAEKFPVPFWVVLLCHAAIGLGTLFGGWRIVKTMGHSLTKLQPIGGFCAETGGGVTILALAHYGIPVSTTHTITGAIVGVGAVHRFSAVRWGVAAFVVAVAIGWSVYDAPAGCEVQSGIFAAQLCSRARSS